MRTKRNSEGIRPRHRGGCPALNDGGRCKCKPAYEAFVYSVRDGRKIRRTFASLAEAKAWRADANVAVRNRTLRAATATTIREAGEAFIAGMRDGSIRTRSGDAYKPSAIRGYEAALRDRINPEFGALKLSALGRADVQALADRMLGEGLDPSTIRNALMPLRVIFRRAIARGEATVNPTTTLELPAVRGKRDRVASPGEAARLLAAVSDEDRALWAAALYGGLRFGELAALDWERVDLAANRLRVERAWDPKAREFIEPKSKAGVRTVPIPKVLREVLVAHKLRSGKAAGLVFASGRGTPVVSGLVTGRARTAWKAAGLSPIGLHEARHTYASLMIAAGVNAKALSTYMGHSSITITLDRYGHLMPGNEEEAAGLLDAHLARAESL